MVSGARYNPILDLDQSVVRDHGWPASHCEEYMQSCCERYKEVPKKVRKAKASKLNDAKAPTEVTPMRAALSAHMSLPSLEKVPSAAALSGLWLGRVCRTASHELGHCFGIAHCNYYACSMQSTASIVEDARQPPYLCPVDLAKVLTATGADVVERYASLLAFCNGHKGVHLFAAYAEVSIVFVRTLPRAIHCTPSFGSIAGPSGCSHISEYCYMSIADLIA